MKTYVLDASALWVFLQHKPTASKILDLLTEAMHRRAEILMSAVNFGEVYALVVREQGIDQARATMNAVHPLPIRLLDATVQRCCHAAETKVKYKFYYADSFAAALAIENNATLVTSDSDFRRLGHNFPVLWLRP
jgi:predicted nucleic acid-binding protein